MAVPSAERDSKREQAFALAARRVTYREIARRLRINKSTVVEYVREERSRRSHDRHAEDAIRDAVAALRHVLVDLQDRYDEIEGSTPHSMYARAKVAETIRRCCRDLIALYGITLPETDPQIVSMRRVIEMVGAPFPIPGGYPEVGEQALMDRHSADLDRRLVDFGVIPEATPSVEDDDGGVYFWYDDGY